MPPSPHSMSEARVFMHLTGPLSRPACTLSARAGMVESGYQSGGLVQHARSKAVPSHLMDLAAHMRVDVLNKLERFHGLDARLEMRGLIRERHVCGLADYRQDYAGFWGSLKVPQHWTSIFGSDPEGEITFRRGPWEEWSPSLPGFEVVDPEMPIILSPYCATLFHEAVGHGLEDDYTQDSPLKFYFGEKVSHEALIVADRPDLQGYVASMNYDDTGAPASATNLIQNGFLVGSLKEGHAVYRRASYADQALVRATNFVISAGEDDPNSWLHHLPECYYVTWIQSGNWHPGTERFKVLTGPIFHLRHGQPYQWREWASLRFSVSRFLKSIVGVGNDVKMDPVVHWCVKQNQRVPMSMGSPSLLLEPLY